MGSVSFPFFSPKRRVRGLRHERAQPIGCLPKSDYAGRFPTPHKELSTLTLNVKNPPFFPENPKI